MLLRIDPSGIRVVVDATRNKEFHIHEIDLQGAIYDASSKRLTAPIGPGADFSGITARVTAVEEDIGTVQGSIASAGALVDSKEADVAALEARIAALEEL